MSGNFGFEAEIRSSAGRGVAKALRRANKVPAVLYGGTGEPVWLVLDHHKVVKKLENEAVYAHVLDLAIDGNEEKAILKAIHRHPYKSTILHMDFQRVSMSEKLRVHVPLRFINEDISVGVKKGGRVTHVLLDLEVSCQADRLPECIEVDLSRVDLGENVHLSDLVLPEGVELVGLAHGAEGDHVVASLHAPLKAEDEEEEENA